ncbi:50S ribosomal protein L18e [Candidatus Geothermarchaeota archaeon ex4572_27]|nr:MAG: 50S ribosomal protein L18e [Candidatus Geothermarchaeota archaeon ex4572_27]
MSTTDEIERLCRWLRKKARENDAPIWRRVAELLNRPRRKRIAVNISRINRHTEEGDWVVVPGKVLGSGEMDHKINIAAFKFSEKAYRKLVESGSRVMSIQQLVEEKPTGSGVKIVT